MTRFKSKDDAFVVADIVVVAILGKEADALVAIVEEEIVAIAGKGDEVRNNTIRLGVGLIGVDKEFNLNYFRDIAHLNYFRPSS